MDRMGFEPVPRILLTGDSAGLLLLTGSVLSKYLSPAANSSRRESTDIGPNRGDIVETAG